jgi:hypothetical protein
MYQTNSSGGFRPHFSNSSGRSPSRRFGSGPSRGGSSQGRRPRFSAQRMNPALFIKKSCDVIKIEEQPTIHSFEDFNLNPTLLNNIKSKGYTKPTQIQDQTIIPVLEKQDVLGIADTGTGKTAAFAIPLINKILWLLLGN